MKVAIGDNAGHEDFRHERDTATGISWLKSPYILMSKLFLSLLPSVHSHDLAGDRVFSKGI